MKKILIITLCFGLFLFVGIAHAAHYPPSIDLGLIESDYYWAYDEPGSYTIDFEVEAGNTINLTVETERKITIYYEDDSWKIHKGDTWSFDYGSGLHSVSISGNILKGKMQRSVQATPIPGALLLFASGMTGLAFVRRKKG